jgi:hypothetical protein
MTLLVPFQEIFQLVPTAEQYLSMPASTAGLSTRDSPDTKHKSYPLDCNTC